MCLKECKGILRASLCLAIGYIEGSDKAYDTREKCIRVVADYLNRNGMKFDFTTKKNETVVRRIVDVAEDVVFSGVSIESALLVLSVKLGIDVNY